MCFLLLQFVQLFHASGWAPALEACGRLARIPKPDIIRAFNPWPQLRSRVAKRSSSFVAEKPTDAFARYGLALECVKLGDDPSATLHFRKLLETHPEYVACYYQFGQLLARLGRLDEARKLLSDGIIVAQKIR